MFAQHGEPAVEVARRQEDPIGPERFEQASRLVDPPLLSQQSQEDVSQGGDFRAGVPQGTAEYAFGLDDPSELDRDLREIDRRGAATGSRPVSRPQHSSADSNRPRDASQRPS